MAGGGGGSRRDEAELGGAPPAGRAPWGWGGPVGVVAVAYVALGGVVLMGLCHRHRVLQSRKRERRRQDQRLFRVTTPGPHSPYGNVLCPTAAPRPPPEPGSPTAGPPEDLWGQPPMGPGGGEKEEEKEEEEEEEEGYEHPDSETEEPGEGYENEPGPIRARSSVGSYENGLEAGLRRALGDGHSEASADAGSYENMEGLRG